MGDKRPIIIIKKKAAHAGHHGGAWKVAYADFVTAMMALFIVLWLTSSGEKVRKSIAGYFNDPLGKSGTPSSGLNGEAENLPLSKDNIKDLKDRLAKQIAQRPDLKALSDQIQIAITPEGMRIELIEAKNGGFFERGSAVLNDRGRELLQLLAKELGTVPNRVSMEGHTDAQPYTETTKYDNWELSVDRANAARRLMQATGLYPGQVSQVRGFADQQLRVPANPLDPSNRRVTVIVQWMDAGPPPTGFAQPEPGSQSAGKPRAGPENKAALEELGVKPERNDQPASAEAKPAAPPPAPPPSPVPRPGLMGKITGLFSRKSAAAPAENPAEKP